jgi:hypothetical protein
MSCTLVASALVSRYVPIVIFPYYIALASQIFAALYAYLFIPETLHVQEKDEEDEEDEEEDEEGPMNIVEVAENLAAPIKPLSLLLPHRDHSTGVFHWKLFFLTISLLTTTSGVRIAITLLR